MACLLAGLCGTGGALPAVQEHYGAALERSAWQVEAGKHRCVLSHEIPHLGQARFLQAAGQPMVFSVVVPPEGQYAQQAVVRAVPPLWRHDATPVVLGGQSLPAKRQELELDPATAQRLYQSLESGLFAEILFLDRMETAQVVQVTVSAVRFRTVLKAFQTCQAGLLEPPPEPADRKSAARTAVAQVTARHPVIFSANSFELTDAARELLLEMSREYRAGPARQRILISGHSDAADDPARAERLAVRRAQEIRGFLVRRGLPPERIQLRGVAPASGSDTVAASGTALGATLWLVR